MDNRPIGVFDSGLGGLTAVAELHRTLPGEDIIYFGDTGRVPYGTRSRETILKYARQDIRFLLGQNIKAIVVACGTVSTAALPWLEAEYAVPLIGVVQPSAAQAARVTRNGRVGLIATQASIRSGAYGRALRGHNSAIEVYDQPCPLLVPLVEAGRVTPGDPVTTLVLEEYLAPIRAWGADTLILGCTHYPLLRAGIEALLPSVCLIDPGAAAADYIAAAPGWERGEKTVGGVTQYFVSDNVEGFARSSSLFLQNSMTNQVSLVDIDTIV